MCFKFILKRCNSVFLKYEKETDNIANCSIYYQISVNGHINMVRRDVHNVLSSESQMPRCVEERKTIFKQSNPANIFHLTDVQNEQTDHTDHTDYTGYTDNEYSTDFSTTTDDSDASQTSSSVSLVLSPANKSLKKKRVMKVFTFSNEHIACYNKKEARRQIEKENARTLNDYHKKQNHANR